jgi:hypothetical protein
LVNEIILRACQVEKIRKQFKMTMETLRKHLLEREREKYEKLQSVPEANARR